MERRHIPWKAEFKAAGDDPGGLSPEEEALVPALERENAAFLALHPRKAPRTAPAQPVLSLRSLGSRAVLWAAPLAAALMIAFGVLAPASEGQERIKGSGAAVLAVYRLEASGPHLLKAGAPVAPGDVLQAAYRTPAGAWGVLVSVDGAGQVTVHLAEGDRAAALTPGAEQPLARSYELDRAPKFETFVLVTSSSSFALADVTSVLASTPWDRLKPGAFGPGRSFTVLPLTKEVKP